MTVRNLYESLSEFVTTNDKNLIQLLNGFSTDVADTIWHCLTYGNLTPNDACNALEKMKEYKLDKHRKYQP